MTPSERRKQMKDEMAQRTQESYNSKDGSGKFKSVFVKEALGKIGWWKCSEDEHFIDIIPYVAGKHNPNVKEGQFAYNLDIFVHRKVGVNEDSFICLARSYGKKCPICDEQARLRTLDDYDDKFVKSLNPTRRVVYNIHCIDNPKEINLGIQLFDVSHFLFEKELAEISKKPRGGGFILFSDPDDGKTVFFRKSGNGPTNTEYKAFKFEDRDGPISDEMLDSAVCLDSLIHVPTYEEVYNSFHGIEVDENQTIVDSGEADLAEAIVSFLCPGIRPTNFGEFNECEECPDVAACEQEFEASAGASAPEPVKEPEPMKAAESAVTSPAGRRRAAMPGADTAAAPTVAAPATDPAVPGGRVRRRPGA